MSPLERDRKVFNELKERGRRSLRKIGAACKLSKDAVRRALRALSGRNIHPESELLETDAGREFVYRLIIAAIFVLGLKSNAGAERLSEFFHLVRLEKRAGVSPSALRSIMRRMEDAVIRYGEKQEAAREGKQPREITAGGDETFFNEMMVMVMMELSSGYIVMEEPAPDRTYLTWNERAQRRLKQLGLKARHFVSDRGKSLVKLALDGLGCRAGADLFHAQYDVSKWLGAGFFGKIGKAAKAVKNATQKLAAAWEKGAEHGEITACERTLKQAREAQYKLERGREMYLEAQKEVSAAVHPFSCRDCGAQTANETEKRLEAQAGRFEEIARTHNISDRSGRLNKFRKQIRDIAETVEAWWIWTAESAETLGLAPEEQDWAIRSLLPVEYWYQQAEKAQNPELKKVYRAAYEKAHAAWREDPVTRDMPEEETERCRVWAEWMSAKFQRASSAIEGRNGCLSLMHHHGRGLSDRRLKTLTVLHNFDTRRGDGTTPAERLFETKFPDLFEWLLGEIGELPLPRKARLPRKYNSLNLQTVAA